jgi:hypothetical protein
VVPVDKALLAVVVAAALQVIPATVAMRAETVLLQVFPVAQDPAAEVAAVAAAFTVTPAIYLFWPVVVAVSVFTVKVVVALVADLAPMAALVVVALVKLTGLAEEAEVVTYATDVAAVQHTFLLHITPALQEVAQQFAFCGPATLVRTHLLTPVICKAVLCTYTSKFKMVSPSTILHTRKI